MSALSYRFFFGVSVVQTFSALGCSLPSDEPWPACLCKNNSIAKTIDHVWLLINLINFVYDRFKI